jgi:hypothetical protein
MRVLLTASLLLTYLASAEAQRPRFSRCYEVCRDTPVTRCDRRGLNCTTRVERICYEVCN